MIINSIYAIRIFNIGILDVNESVIKEAEKFIQNALLHNFKSPFSELCSYAMMDTNKFDA